MKTWAAAAITVVLAGGVSAMVEVIAGDSAADVLTSNDVGVDHRIVVVSFDAATSVDGADNYLSFDGFAYNSIASLAAAFGARAIGFVDFDSLAFGDGGSGRAFVVGSEPIASLAIIPFLDVAIDRNVGGIPLVTDYRLDLLASETAGVGLPIVNDSVVRSVPAIGRVVSFKNGAIIHVPQGEADQVADRAVLAAPGLALRLVEKATNRAITDATRRSLKLGDAEVPLENGFLRIRWSERLDNRDDISVVPYGAIASGQVDRSIFKDAIVLVGSTDPSQTSFYATPVGSLPAVLVHANAVNTLLTADYLVPESILPPSLVAVSVVLLLVVLRRSRWRFAVAVATCAGWLVAVHVLTGQGHLVAPLLVPVACLTAAVVMEAIKQLDALAERRQLRALFSQYVPAAVADQLVGTGRSVPASTGERLSISVLFCDLRGFTPLAAALEPSQVRVLLNTYYELIGTVAFQSSGTIMQYTGDEIFVVFGAPVPMTGHAEAAVTCAKQMFATLTDLNLALRAEALPSLNFGIGINSGDVVAAHVGTAFRRQYSVIGDAVNVASRHVGIAAAGQIVISSATMAELALEPEGDDISVQLKGVDGPRTARVINAGPTAPCGTPELLASTNSPVDAHLQTT